MTRWLLVYLLLGVLVTVCVERYLALGKEKEKLSIVAHELDLARRHVERIQSLERSPKRASARDLRLTDLTRAIEEAGAVAGIPSASLERIEPEPPRRVQDTPYLEKRTQIEIAKADLPAVLRFLSELSKRPEGLAADTVRLRAPHDEKLGTEWTLEATLTRLIYRPQEQPVSPR